jgi:hypothetical protein
MLWVAVDTEDSPSTGAALGLTVHPQGHATFDGDFPPIYIEFHNGQVRVCVWDDVNDQEPTIISLENARENARQE